MWCKLLYIDKLNFRVYGHDDGMRDEEWPTNEDAKGKKIMYDEVKNQWEKQAHNIAEQLYQCTFSTPICCQTFLCKDELQ